MASRQVDLRTEDCNIVIEYPDDFLILETDDRHFLQRLATLFDREEEQIAVERYESEAAREED